MIGDNEGLVLGRLAGADAMKALVIVAVMTVHSAAEGVGVGVSYGGGERLGLLITIAIAVHNIPEGLAISLVLVPRGATVAAAAGWSIFSSLPQPLIAPLAFLFVETFTPFLPAGLGFAAGAMIWMVFSELLPEAIHDASKRRARPRRRHLLRRDARARRCCCSASDYNASVPIYEYVCMECESHFEELVRGDQQVACPDCSATNVSRQFSTFAVHGARRSSRPTAAAPAGAGAVAAPAAAATRSDPVAEQQGEHLTRAQRAQLEAELAELEGPRRRAIVEAIAVARGHGDLSENFEYHSAKNEQGLLERRITILRSRLHNAVEIDEEAAAASGVVAVGSHVEIEREDGERMKVEISSVGGVSPDSPVGRAVLGKAVGDEIVVEAPRGQWKGRIVALGR